MKVLKIHFNWHAGAFGEEYEVAEVGVVRNNKLVKEIEEHRAAGEGDKWYYDIKYNNDTTERTFYPNQVFMKEDKINF